jgi:hypothetical protein
MVLVKMYYARHLIGGQLIRNDGTSEGYFTHAPIWTAHLKY